MHLQRRNAGGPTQAVDKCTSELSSQTKLRSWPKMPTAPSQTFGPLQTKDRGPRSHRGLSKPSSPPNKARSVHQAQYANRDAPIQKPPDVSGSETGSREWRDRPNRKSADVQVSLSDCQQKDLLKKILAIPPSGSGKLREK